MTFDPDFASAGEWARLYRSRGLQVLPACSYTEVRPGTAWKRPLFRSWVEYQEALVPDDKFNEWYGPGGTYVARPNMGLICGRASGGRFVIDLDIHKHAGAIRWWGGLMAVHNNGMELETVEQRTGGGGLQKIFQAPPGWTPPTCKTSIGVDVRGQGGWAMMAPSMHESGKPYVWLEGHAPDEAEILMAPLWLVEAVDALVREHGGGTSTGPRVRSADSQSAFDGFGHQTDGREEKMRDLVWGAVVDWYRECPIKPSDAESRTKAAEKYLVYEELVSPQAYDPALTKTQMLDREGRGPDAFWGKWSAAMRRWDDKVAEEAKQPGKSSNYRAGAQTFDYGDEFASAKPKVDPSTGQPLPLLLTAEQFLAGFRPPDYLVDGMIQRSYLISLTARTGHGKTAVAMLMGVAVARGTPFHGKPVEQGGVLFLAGENPDDIRARYLALAEHEGFDPHGIPFHFVDGVINIQTEMPRIRLEAENIPNLSLVIIDTQAAYFLGDEGNSNEQQGWFARLLRELIKLPGRPAVLVNCHPVKNASQDNLIPMGGSAFINEVDANLTLWADDKTCVLGPHPDKWRGVAFETLSFELRVTNTDRLKDTKGRHIPSVIAVPITEDGAERRAAVADEDAKTVLRLIHTEKNASLGGMAQRAGWAWPDGRPAKSKVQKICERLHKSKLVYKQYNGKYRLTKAGCRVIEVKWEGEPDPE